MTQQRDEGGIWSSDHVRRIINPNFRFQSYVTSGNNKLCFQGLEEFYVMSQPTKVSIPKMKFDRYLMDIAHRLDVHKANEPVLQWIDKTISPDDKLESPFIRALTTAVCNSAIVQGTI